MKTLIILNFENIKKASINRPSSYIKDLIENSTLINTNENGDIISLGFTKEKYELLKIKYRPEYISEYAGVGYQLKKILSSMYIISNNKCRCDEYSNTMNNNGIEWCENNLDTIISWLREEAHKRHLPFIEYAAKIIIKKAIKNAKEYLKFINKKSS